MKRKIVSIIIIIVCFLLQSTLFGKLTFSSVRPNLMIIAVSSFGFMRGKREGMMIGFATGLLVDVFWGGTLGFYALIYTAIGYLNGFYKHLFYDEDIKLPLVLISASELLYGIIIYVCFFALQGDFQFGYYLTHVILPELIYTILITLVLYQIILHINRKLETEEQRSASKFV